MKAGAWSEDILEILGKPFLNLEHPRARPREDLMEHTYNMFGTDGQGHGYYA